MNTIQIILLASCGLLFVIQILYLFLLYKVKRIASPLTTNQSPNLPPLSVVIPTSNQDFLLKKNLPLILEQDYPDFEVVVVDDNSTDETADILQQLQARYPRLRTTFVPPTSRRISHHKLALTLGIKATTNDWLVFTEADCHPATSGWLRSLAAQLSPLTTNSSAVVGYTGYDRSRGLSAALRGYDTLLRGLRLLGLASHGKAHMAYGTNLLYRRDIFFGDAKGYSRHLNLERGDDDIFVNENIRPAHIRAAVSPDAVVRCADTSRRHWRLERLSRIATRRYLRGIRPLTLGFDTLSRVLYILFTIAAIVLSLPAVHRSLLGDQSSVWWLVIGIVALLWLIRYVLSWIVWNRSSRALGERSFGPALPLLEALHPLWELALRIQYLFSSKQRYRRKLL